jgi:hypothetical protein
VAAVFILIAGAGFELLSHGNHRAAGSSARRCLGPPPHGRQIPSQLDSRRLALRGEDDGPNEHPECLSGFGAALLDHFSDDFDEFLPDLRTRCSEFLPEPRPRRRVLEQRQRRPGRRMTVGADKGYVTHGCIQHLRALALATRGPRSVSVPVHRHQICLRRRLRWLHVTERGSTPNHPPLR